MQDAGVQGALGQSRLDRLGRHFLQIEQHAWVRSAKGLHERGRVAQRSDRGVTDPQPAFSAVADGRHRRARARQRIDRLPGIGQKQPPPLREQRAPNRSLEQRKAEFVFEPLNACRQRRLRQAEGLGGEAKGATRCDFREALEAARIHRLNIIKTYRYSKIIRFD